MRAWTPLYEGDGVIRYSGATALPRTASEPAARKTSLLGSIGKAFGALARWLEESAERARYRQLESYLAGSTDLCELERRMREIERSRGGRFDYPF